MEVTLAEIAAMVAGTLKGDGDKIIRKAAPFDAAAIDDITFAGDARFLKRIESVRAGAVIVPQGFKGALTNLIFVENPQVAFAKVLTFFSPPKMPQPGINPNTHVGSNVVFGKDISIAPFVVIQNNVTLGDRVNLHPNVVIGDDVVIGNDVVIYPNVTILERCRIGNRVIVHAGTVIGSDGFGFAPDGKRYYKIPQTGIVQIDDDVEIGAGNTIDRGTFDKTWIRQGVKTDNLVHIAHNVTVGENTVIVAQVGIAGSVVIGSHVILAGQAAVGGHLEIGDDVVIGPRAGISKSIPSGAIVSGAPEMPHRLWLRVQRIIPRLPELKKKIDDLEKRLRKIEKNKIRTFNERQNEKDI